MASGPRAGFVGGRIFDLAFLFGSGALAFLVGVALLLRPGWTALVWWLFTLLADGPHLILTVTRTYLDPRDRGRLGLVLWLVPLWLLLGPLALVVSRVSGSRGPWDLFLLFAAVWSYQHVIRQHYGLLAISERQVVADRWISRLDGLFLQGALWGLTVVFQLVTPASRASLMLPVSLGLVERAVVASLVPVLGVAAIGWLAAQVLRARRGRRMLPAWFVLGPVCGLYALNLFVVGAREPLLAEPANVEQCFLAVTAVGGLVHGLQYVGIVTAANRRRYGSAPDAPGLAAWLGRSPIRAYLVAVGVSIVAYGLLTAARGAPGVAFFGLESDAARLFLGLYWGLFFMHYHLDQIIWHPSKDPSLREDLGLAQAA
jgi:hypothetical protein